MSERIVLTRLKKTRTNIGLTQEELANMVDITPRTIQRIESGAPTSLSTAKDIASVLELPSFKIMTGTPVKEIPPLLEQVNAHMGKLTTDFLKNRQPLMLCFTAIVSLMLMLPVQGGLLTVAFFLGTFLPFITIWVLTIESKPSKKSELPPYLTWVLLIACLIVAQACVPVFISLSMMHDPDLTESFRLSRVFVISPGPIMFATWFMDNRYMLWVISGAGVVFSLLAMHYLIHQSRVEGYWFSRFAEGYVLPFMFYAAISLLFYTDFFAGLQPSNLYIYIASLLVVGPIAYYSTQYKSASTKEEKTSLKAGITCFILPGAIVITTLSLFYGTYLEDTEMRFDNAKKASYCKVELDDAHRCWEAQLLRKHNISITEEHLSLLGARNGNLLAINNAASGLVLSKGALQIDRPLPKSVITFFAKSYARAIEYQTQQGSLSILVNTFTSGKLSLLVTPEKHRAWVDLALHDKQKFIRDLDIAPYSVKNDPYLKTIHTALTGKWKIITSGDSDYYRGGRFQFRVKGDRTVNTYNTLTVEALEQILLIDESELPNILSRI
jgi:DNA-binding XRE family transcriptional regulator